MIGLGNLGGYGVRVARDYAQEAKNQASSADPDKIYADIHRFSLIFDRVSIEFRLKFGRISIEFR